MSNTNDFSVKSVIAFIEKNQLRTLHYKETIAFLCWMLDKNKQYSFNSAKELLLRYKYSLSETAFNMAKNHLKGNQYVLSETKRITKGRGKPQKFYILHENLTPEQRDYIDALSKAWEDNYVG